MVVSAKDAETFDDFQGFNPSHKDETIDVISNYDDIF